MTTRLTTRSLPESTDVLIIGAGLYGCTLARELSLRGVSVVLVDKGDIGSGASGSSSKLALGKANAALTTLIERKRLVQNAPHLMSMLPFIQPFYSQKPPQQRLQRLFSKAITGNHHEYRVLSKEETIELEPSLDADTLTGSILYYDAMIDNARYCLELALQAQQFGAEVFGYCRVLTLMEEDQLIRKVMIEDRETHEEVGIYCKALINCSGAWANQFPLHHHKKTPPLKGCLKGLSIITPKLARSHALSIPIQNRGVIYVTPWADNSLVGCLFTPHKGHLDDHSPDETDIQFLLSQLNQTIADPPLTRDDVFSVMTGVYPVVQRHITRHLPNAWTLVGTEFSSHRSLCNQMVKTLGRYLKLGHFSDLSQKLPVYAGDFSESTPGQEEAWLDEELYPLSKELVQLIRTRYGSVYQNVLSVICEQGPYKYFLPNTQHVRGEVIYAIRHELATRIEDFMARRTQIAFGEDRGQSCIHDVASLFQQELGWDDTEKERAVRQYLAMADSYDPNTLKLW